MWGIGNTIKIVAVALVVAILAGGAWYVMNLKTDLAISRETVSKLTDGIKQQQAVIDQITADVARVQKANRDLSALSAQQRAEIEALVRKFNQNAQGQPRDLGALAAQRPDTIQRLMNAATRNAMRCLEIASGSPRTPVELDARTASEINRECPALANPNYRGLLP